MDREPGHLGRRLDWTEMRGRQSDKMNHFLGGQFLLRCRESHCSFQEQKEEYILR